jgi:hypothetical protein
MGVVQSAGAALYIGTTTAADTQVEFEADTYVEVGEITNFGEFGKSYNLVTHNPVKTRRTQKFKGSYNEGSLQLTLGRDPADAGQEDLLAALDEDASYNVKITFGDAPPSGTPTTQYFRAKVMSYTTNIGAVDGTIQSSVTLEIDSDIIEVAAGT